MSDQQDRLPVAPAHQRDRILRPESAAERFVDLEPDAQLASRKLSRLPRPHSRAGEHHVGAACLLQQRLPAGGRDEVGRIAASFNVFAEKIQRILLDVRSASNSISTASSEIAIGAQDLSQRTEQTASNLQQAASSMEELTATVRQTADAAQTANQLASSASSAAARGWSR